MLEHFFSHLSRNTTGEYEREFPFLSRRMHERYYARSNYDGDDEGIISTDTTRHPPAHRREDADAAGAPMVFTDFDAETG
jgi:hypothetical protein